MATNLRLRPDAERAIRAEAARTGRSQQELIRAAVDQYLGLSPASAPRTESDALIASGVVMPARSPYRVVSSLLSLPEGVTTIDLLDRDDRI
ncbi:MAG: ribbon-helix-helix protein, CopG family [Chloroflexota bacterium]|nr:MAG: hypothetical protein DLM70_07360 [Chloroflexota bacterium]